MFKNPTGERQASKKFCNKCSENSRSQIVFRAHIFRKLTLGAPESITVWASGVHAVDSGFHVLDSGLQSLSVFWISCGEFPGFRITLDGTRDVLTPPLPPWGCLSSVVKRAIFVEISNSRFHITEDLVGICCCKDCCSFEVVEAIYLAVNFCELVVSPLLVRKLENSVRHKIATKSIRNRSRNIACVNEFLQGLITS